MTLDGGSVEPIETEARPERRTRMSWPDEDTAILRDMAAKGHSGSGIARALGRSRNSIIGRALRLNIKLQGVPFLLKDIRAPKTRAKLLPTAQVVIPFPKAQAPVAPVSAALEPLLKEIWQLEPHECRFAVNEGGPYLFCGHKREGKSAYCAHHQTICTTTHVYWGQK